MFRREGGGSVEEQGDKCLLSTLLGMPRNWSSGIRVLVSISLAVTKSVSSSHVVYRYCESKLLSPQCHNRI